MFVINNIYVVFLIIIVFLINGNINFVLIFWCMRDFDFIDKDYNFFYFFRWLKSCVIIVRKKLKYKNLII